MVGVVCAAVLVACDLGVGAAGFGAGGFVALRLGGVAVAGAVVAMDGLSGRWAVQPLWASAGLHQPRGLMGQRVAPDPAKTVDGLGLG